MKLFLSVILLSALLAFHLAGADAVEDGTGAYSNMAPYNFIFEINCYADLSSYKLSCVLQFKLTKLFYVCRNGDEQGWPHGEDRRSRMERQEPRGAKIQQGW